MDDAAGRGDLTVALWQAASVPGDVAANLERLERACAEAAAGGADVLVAPELQPTGYAIGAEATGRLAEPLDGGLVSAIAAISARTSVAICTSVPESHATGVANTAVLVDDGRLLGAHRKIHLFAELDRPRFVPGDAPPTAVELRGHRVAMLVCYDVEFPESVRACALDGAEAVLVPTANPEGYEIVSEVLVRARAYENGLWIAYANHCGDSEGVTYAGLSTVCGPAGQVAALAGAGEELTLVTLTAPAEPLPDYLREHRPGLYRRT